MVTAYTGKMTSKDIVASPKDEILEAYIVKVERGLLSEFIPDKVHAKFDNLEQDTLQIYFEYKFNDKVLSSVDRISFYEEPSEHSKLAKYIRKYETSPTVGQKIKVEFNTDGFSSIRIN